MLLSTGTLPVRESPYDLIMELARGTLNRLRNQISIWQEGGLTIAETIVDKVACSIHLLGQAIMSEDKADQDIRASESIELAMDAIFELSDAFSSQISKYRRENDELTNFWVSNSAGAGGQFLPSTQHPNFDLVRVGNHVLETLDEPVSIDEVGKRIIVGPWLDASAGGMPESLQACVDHATRRDVLLKQCRNRLETLPEKASLIHLVSGLNGIGHRHLSYPQQLQLTIDLLQQVDESLNELPVMVSFDFPWAERLASAVGGIHPLQIADSLLRQGVRISFFGLEINLDYWPGGSVIRDPLQWIDMIDSWAQLDLPLILCLRIPSGSGPEPPESSAQSVDRLVNRQQSNVTERQRLEFLKTVLPMMVARPAVHGIIWQQWQDVDDRRFPHAGIIDASGNPKPIAEVLQVLRQTIDGS
jgi:hypothetical protein